MGRHMKGGLTFMWFRTGDIVKVIGEPVPKPYALDENLASHIGEEGEVASVQGDAFLGDLVRVRFQKTGDTADYTPLDLRLVDDEERERREGWDRAVIAEQTHRVEQAVRWDYLSAGFVIATVILVIVLILARNG